MGIFDLFKANNRKSEVDWHASGSSQNKGRFESVDIVGESFYIDAFKQIRTHLGLSADSEAEVQVELRVDPGNPHASDGKAVAAYILGEKVGHVSSLMATGAFDALQREGGKRTFKGRVYFGDLRENPPKNSVSITWEVQTKSPQEKLAEDERVQKDQAKRDAAEIVKRDFLKNPDWSNHTLVAGDRVTFTGFTQFHDLPKLTDSIIGDYDKSSKGVHLLVVHPSIESDSAKLRNWLGSKKPATNLQTFLDFNPEFAAYFNEDTQEFDVPRNITGEKEPVVRPSTQRIFESDSSIGSPSKRMDSDLILLPEQTLAYHPSFTVYGSFNWRLSDVKNYRAYIEQLFAEVNGAKNDAILLKGDLKETTLDGEIRIVFEFRGQPVGLVPKNETISFVRDSKAWKAHPVLALISWNFKNVISGEHDAGLTEAYHLP